jgi:hypothetical protein
MAVKGGDIIHVANETALIDRLQTAGPGQVNIRRETIYELGNYRSVGQVSDIPDLSFSMESQDVTPEMEAFLLDVDPATTHEYDLAEARVVNIKSAFKPGQSATSPFVTATSAAIPCLRLEQMQYRFGVGNQNARQTATLRGDSLYYNPGSTYIQRVAGTGTAAQVIVSDQPAYGITEGGTFRRTLAVTAGSRRLNFGSDYTESYGTVTANAAVVTVTLTEAVAVEDTVAVTYASPTVESFPQSVHALVSGVYGELTAISAIGDNIIDVDDASGLNPGDVLLLNAGTVDEETVVVASVASDAVTLEAVTVNAHGIGDTWTVYAPTVKPAAIRGRDIDIYIGPSFPDGTDADAARGTKRGGVQSADVDWRVTLQMDEEMGNYHYSEIDFDVPQVSGSLTFRAGTPQMLLTLMRDLSGETTGVESAQSQDSPLLDVQIALKDPATGRVLKRLHIPDARFSLPGYSGRVQQKLDLQASFQSDQGILKITDS